MKSSLLFLLPCLWLCASLKGQQPRQTNFQISGLMLNARDNSPVRHAQVSASLVTQGRGGFREPVRAETDEAGRFLFDLPSAGNWQVNVSAHNIHSQNFEEHEGFFSGVVLTSASPVYDLVFHAVPDAILTGTVTDEFGEPVRNAQVALFAVDASARQTGGQPMQQRQGTQTDDRGRYEIASLQAGVYMVQVQARPWYASTPPIPWNPAGDSSPQPPAQPIDPPLDVAYPITWYPGGSDMSTAGTLAARPGESLQADFRLLPVPSGHLVIPSAVQRPVPLGRRVQNGEAVTQPQPSRGNPNISLVLQNGTIQPVFGQITQSPRGDLEIGGLAPGTYQVTTPGGPDSAPRTSIVQLRAGGTSVDLSTPQQNTAVTISVDGDQKVHASQVLLRSRITGQTFPDFNTQEMHDRMVRAPDGQTAETPRGRSGPPQQRGSQSGAGSPGRPGGQAPGAANRSRGRSASDSDEATLQLPSGSYEVNLAGGTNAFLTGITAKAASAVGRVVTISESPAHLTVHVGTGFATVHGTAFLDGKPAVAALVLLVPATMGDPESLAVVHRDQTNTDGSFRLDNVVPGPYILVAIDHGWSVHWTDPQTLGPYLMRGIPLDLQSAATATPRLTAITP